MVDNHFGEIGTKKLTEALATNVYILTLNVGSNNIGDRGAKHIADMLKVNNTLKELRIYGNLYIHAHVLIANGICNEGAKLLADAFQINTSLTHVNLNCKHLPNMLQL